MTRAGQQTVAGYEVLKVLGHGAGSTIYEVRDPRDGQRYALKRVIRKLDTDQRFMEQLEVEYKVATAVNHRNLRRCSDLKKKRAWFKTTEAYLVMELLEGRHLGERRPRNLAMLVKVFLLVADALAAMAEAGYVHADMKPQNIIITREGKVRVIDFGQSCPLGAVKQRIQGTPDYIAPEQVRRRPLTAQTDMFNFGATLYWCLTEHNVPTLIPKMDEEGRPLKRRERFYPPIHYRPDLPYALNKLVLHLLRTRPSDRPESWAAVRDALRLIYVQLTRTQPAAVPAPDRATVATRPAARHTPTPRQRREKSGTGEMCVV